MNMKSRPVGRFFHSMSNSVDVRDEREEFK